MNRLAARKWLEIVRFELFHQLARRSMWIFLAICLFMLIGQTNGQVIRSRESGVAFHAPLYLAQSSLLLGMIGLLVIAAVTGDAATRDVQTRMEPLLRTAPIGRIAYFSGRFCGALLTNALISLSVPLALILAPYVHTDLDPEAVGPFRAVAHLQSFFVLVLPNVFMATAFCFALASLVRHTLGSYFGAGIVLAITILGKQVFGHGMGDWDLAALLDPLGHTSIDVLMRTWSPIDASTRLVGVDGGLFGNRLLWCATAWIALAFAYSRFRRSADVSVGRSSRRVRSESAVERAGGIDDSVFARAMSVALPVAPRDFGPKSRVRQTLAVARDSLRELATGWSWLVLPFVALQTLAATEGLEARGTPLLPTTHRVLAAFAEMPPPLLIALFVFTLLYAGELVWRERDANIHALVDAAPVSDGARFVGKLLGLWFVIVLLKALMLVGGVILQLSLGDEEIEPLLYLQILFGLDLIGPLVFALFALSVHVLVDRKHVGHLVVAVFLLAEGNLAPMLGIEHPMLLPLSGPSWQYSPIRGFEPFLAPVLWFATYWAAWTVLLATASRLFAVRGVKPRFAERMRIAQRRFTGRTAAVFAAVAGIVVLVGGFVFYNTNVVNTYRSRADIALRQVEYERRYAHHADAPQPVLVATKFDVEIHPDRREALVRGVHRLENRTQRPIETIHVAVASGVVTADVEFDRPARVTLLDDDLGHRIYELDEPLPPGDSLRLEWDVHYRARGFTADGIATDVVENGTFIRMHEWMPLVGYQPRRELSDAVAREEHGLVERPDLPSLDDVDARSDPHGQERIDVDVTIGTAIDQIALAPGELRRTWTSEDRRYFHYATSAPIGTDCALFSAEYAVDTARWRDVALEVAHHPAHDLNVPRMLRGMEASLEQFTERFGPYPHEVLRMIEYPSAGGSLHAESSSIRYAELFSLFDADHDARNFDLPFAVVAHEVAHQWWGGQLGYARVEGAPVLSESLAWYSALDVIEAEYGSAHLRRFLDFMRTDYLDPRSRADVPLLRAADWFLAYRKGPFAMYALREYVGGKEVDLALRRLLERHRARRPPFPTSLDLYHELQVVTPESLRYLLHDLFEANTFWELETERSIARSTVDGAWEVTLDVEARKVVVDSEGRETIVPMEDWVEIGVFAAVGGGSDLGEPLHLEKHLLRSGKQTIQVTVAREPARAGIDPRHLLIDVEMDDNVAHVEIGS